MIDVVVLAPCLAGALHKTKNKMEVGVLKIYKILAVILTMFAGMAVAEVYSVTDVTLTDHGDPFMSGSIAKALADCENDGGGVVSIGKGNYKVLTGLHIGRNCRVIGEGRGATMLTMKSSFVDFFTVASGRNSIKGDWSLENLSLHMESINSGDFLETVPLQANLGTVRKVTMTGGSVESWGLNINAALHVEIFDVIYQGEGNGFIFQNTLGYNYNAGDSIIQNSDVILRNPNTTGIRLASPANSTNRINNILLNRVEVQTPFSYVLEGTVGVHLHNVARVTLSHVDLERLEVAVLQQSGVNGGSVAVSNSFVQTFSMGCTNDYVEEGIPPIFQSVIGGNGDFAENQRLPGNEIFVRNKIVGINRVLTAVRPIEAYFDTLEPRVLSTEDSGKIFTNKNAQGTVTFELPPANQGNSMEYEFHLVELGKSIRIQPADGDLIRPGQTAVSSYYESGGSWGTMLKIRNVDGTIWSVIGQHGDWQSE